MSQGSATFPVACASCGWQGEFTLPARVGAAEITAAEDALWGEHARKCLVRRPVRRPWWQS